MIIIYSFKPLNECYLILILKRWSTLEIESNERMDDHQQAYAAGFLEGKLTKGLIIIDVPAIRQLFYSCYI